MKVKREIAIICFKETVQPKIKNTYTKVLENKLLASELSP